MRFQYGVNETRRKPRVKDKKVIIYTRKNDIYTPLHPGQLWAYFRQLSGDEIHRAKQDRREEDTQFIVNYRPDHADWDYIACHGIFYNITRVDTFEGYKDDLTIYAHNIQGQPDPEEVREWAENHCGGAANPPKPGIPKPGTPKPGTMPLKVPYIISAEEPDPKQYQIWLDPV
jgi:head-tail adaptor